MPDSFHVMGDEIHYGPWHVMDIRADIPASVRDKIVEALEEMLTYEDQDKLEEEAYDRGWSDAFDESASRADAEEAAYQRGWDAARKDSEAAPYGIMEALWALKHCADSELDKPFYRRAAWKAARPLLEAVLKNLHDP